MTSNEPARTAARRRLRPLAALAVVVVIGAGCSNAAAETGTDAASSEGNGTSVHAQALEFAACMRDNGVKDFPDPALGDPLVDTNRIPSSATDGGMTILDAAMQACGDVAAQAGVEGP